MVPAILLFVGCVSCSALFSFHSATSRFWLISTSRGSSSSSKGARIHPAKHNSLIDENKEIWRLPRLFIGGFPSVTSLCGADLPLSRSLRALIGPNSLSVKNASLCENPTVTLSTDQSHYLSTVLRLNKAKEPPKIRLFDGREEWLAEIDVEANAGRRAVSSQRLTASSLRLLRSNKFARSSCWIFVAAPKKKDRCRWLVEKCTELNAAGMIFLETDFSESPERFHKVFSYAVEAAEQCERLDPPRFVRVAAEGEIGNSNGSPSGGETLYTTKMSTVLDVWPADPDRFPILVCRERTVGAMSAVEVMQSIINEKTSDDRHDIACFVGPEGGWSEREEKLFDAMEEQFPAHFYNVALGATVLRTETAATVVAAAHSMTCMQSYDRS
ncbi:hypothetical protein ACA910_005933 [Epithemia clementina (nom. ined.)]